MTLTIEHPDWMLDAECTRADPGLFYPEPVSRSVDAAKKICADCTVTAQCLAYALTHGELNVGVWGGLSVTERRDLAWQRRPRRDNADCGTENGYHAHRRRGERACHPCRAASAAATRDRRQRRHSA